MLGQWMATYFLDRLFFAHDFRTLPDSLCRVHKPGVPNGPASQRKLDPADSVATTRAFRAGLVT